MEVPSLERTSLPPSVKRGLFILAGLVAGANLACAQNWTGAVSSAWNNAANWSPAAVPVSGNTIIINTPAGNSPQLPSGTTNTTLTYVGFDNTNASFSSLALGNNQTLVGDSVYLGYLKNAQGALTVNGTTAVLKTTAPSSGAGLGLVVGYNGTGNLAITNGGTFAAPAYRSIIGFNRGSNGSVTVDGPGSTFRTSRVLYVGFEGNGTMIISGGGNVGGSSNLSFSGIVGYSQDGNGTLVVTGAGSVFNATSLQVGSPTTGRSYGKGTLVASQGGLVSSPAITVNTLSAIVLDGGLVAAGSLKSDGVLQGDGNFSGEWASNGTLSPGPNGGLKLLSGNATLNGESDFQIADATHYSRFAVGTNGTLQFGGNLNVNLPNTSLGGTFALFTADHRSGEFAHVAVSGAYNGTLVYSSGTWIGILSGTLFAFSSTTGVLTVSLPPTITLQPANTTITAGQTALLSVTAGNPTGISYQWYLGASGDTSQPLTDATNSTLTTPALTGTTSFWVRLTNSIGSADSAAAVVGVIPAVPSAGTKVVIRAGKTATMTIDAGDFPDLHYQWYQGVTGDTSHPLDGATAATFTTTALDASAQFWVRVSNSAGSANSGTFTVNVTPAILVQPANRLAKEGATVKFTVSALGAPPLRYQWRKNGQAIATATQPTLTLGNVTSLDNGTYSVVVSNGAGQTTSTGARLIVNKIAPKIYVQPLPVFARTGQNARFTVKAIGDAPLFYQWQRNNINLTDTLSLVGSSKAVSGSLVTSSSSSGGLAQASPPSASFRTPKIAGTTIISGATTATLTLTKITAASAGNYRVIVTNGAGSAISTIVKLTLLTKVVK